MTAEPGYPSTAKERGATVHKTSVAWCGVPTGDGYRTRCSCGWMGEATPIKAVAIADCRAHEEAVAADRLPDPAAPKRWWRRKPKSVRSFDTDDLRDAAEHLSGWTYSGSGDLSRFRSPVSLLRDAAAEIDRLNRESDA